MRNGAEVRVSTPISVASAVTKATHLPVKVRKSPAQAESDKIRKNLFEIRRFTPGRQAGNHRLRPCAREMPSGSGPEPETRRRRRERPPAPAPLEPTPPRTAVRANHQDERKPPGRCWRTTRRGAQTHAVDHQPPRFGRGIDHLAARAHAEGIDAPAAFRVVLSQGIIGRRHFGRMTMSILDPVDQFPRMFDPHSNRKRLRLKRTPARAASDRCPGHCARAPGPASQGVFAAPSRKPPATTRP